MSTQIQTIASQRNTEEQLIIKHILGYNTDFRNNIYLHPKDQQIIYPAANLIVINNDNKQQSFQKCTPGTKGITAMAQSRDKRLLAWAEESSPPNIVVINLKNDKSQKKIFQAKEGKSTSYISIDFCPPHEGDGKIKYMIALTDGPDYFLHHFQIDKPKYLGGVSVVKQGMEHIKYSHAFYHPKEDDFALVLGQGLIRSFKLSHDQPPKPLTQGMKKDNKDLQHSPNYQAYCILNDGTMVVGTDMGELLIFHQNCELRMILPESPKLEQFQITTIIPYSKGFLVGGQDCTILIYEKIEEHKKPYTRIGKKIQCREYRSPINCLLMADDKENNLIIGLENNQMLYVPFNSERVQADDQLKFEHQLLPFHSQEITGMDICIRKALVGTCSTDKTVRIWNYQEHTLENFREFEEKAYSLAFHPSGFHIVVAFENKIRIMNLFEKDIVPFREITSKFCQEIVFSQGGNLFAFTNESMVQIYNFYTGDLASNINNNILRGAGRVNSIFFEDDDLTIYTGNSEGVVKFWRLDEYGSANEEILNQPGFEVTSIVSLEANKIQVQQQSSSSNNDYKRKCYVAGIHRNSIADSEKCIYEIEITLKYDREQVEKNKKKYVVSEPVKIFTEANISKISLLNSSKLFFFCSSELGLPGSVRVSPFYFDPKADVFEVQSHKQGISRLKVSFDDNYLFTSSKDRSLIIYEIKNKEKVKFDNMQFSEEFLIPQEQYNKEQLEIEQLTEKRMKQEFNQKQIQMEIQRKIENQISQLKYQKKNMDDEERQKIEELENQKKEKERQNEERKQKFNENHEYQKKMIEKDYNKKIAMEKTRNEELQKEVEREKKRFENEEREIREKHRKEMEDKRRQFETKKQELDSQIKQLFAQQQEMNQEFAHKQKDLESTAEEQIEFIKETNEIEMKNLFAELDKQEIQKKSRQSYYEQEASKLEEERSKLKEILEQINTLTEQNKASMKIREGQLKEIHEREKTINDKIRRIYELKKKTQELEKFKFVLDYKIKELKRDIGPKEEEIAKMKEQVQNMRGEISHFRRNNATLSLIVTDLRLRQKGMTKEIEQLTETEKNLSNYINNYKQDVKDCYQEIYDYKKLKQQCLKLYNKYVQEDNKKIYDGDKQKDYIKERDHLETTVAGLKMKFAKSLVVHETDYQRIMEQNVDLIKELNELQREKKNQDDQIKLQEKQKTQQVKQQSLSQIDKDIQQKTKERSELQARIENQLRINEQLREQLQYSQQNQQQMNYEEGDGEEQQEEYSQNEQNIEQYQEQHQLQEQEYQQQYEQREQNEEQDQNNYQNDEGVNQDQQQDQDDDQNDNDQQYSENDDQQQNYQGEEQQQQGEQEEEQ